MQKETTYSRFVCPCVKFLWLYAIALSKPTITPLSVKAYVLIKRLGDKDQPPIGKIIIIIEKPSKKRAEISEIGNDASKVEH